MKLSIRTSLILGTTAATVVALAIAGALFYSGIRKELLDQVDRSLEDEARLLASSVEDKPEGIDTGFEDLDMRQFTSAIAPTHLELWSPTGKVLYRSPKVRAHALVPFDAPPGSLEKRWIEIPGAGKARAVGYTFYPRIPTDDDDESGAGTGKPPEPKPVQLVIARQPVEAERLLGTARTLFVLIGATIALGAALLLYLVIRKVLRPLEWLAEKIGGLRDDDLGRRLTLPNVPIEIEPVVDQINRLLGRLETALERERAFSADVAHELRTPLSGLRSTMDVALSRPRAPEEYREALSESWAIVSQMQSMVEKLLYLGRLESDRLEVTAGVVDLAELVDLAWAPVSPTASRRSLNVRFQVPSHLRIVTDESLFIPAIRNALENAAAYADQGGRLQVVGEVCATGEASATGDTGERTVALHIVNSGSEIPQTDVEALFDRFFRRDAARSATGEHFGLGLPIIKRIATRLGHAIEIRTEVGGDFRLTFLLRTAEAPVVSAG